MSTQNKRTQLRFLLDLFTESIITLRIATSKLPKQIDPNEYVVALLNESTTALEQNDEASSGANHHVPTVPLTRTVEMFFVTSDVQYPDIMKYMIAIDEAALSISVWSCEKVPEACSIEISAINCNTKTIVFIKGVRKANTNTVIK